MVEAQVRVIYGDTDQMGVVYYANYFRYFEASRSEFFRAKGGSYTEFEKLGLLLPVIEANANYKASAKYDEQLVVRVRITQIRRVSLRFEYEVVRLVDQQLLCTGHTVHACIDKSGRLTSLPASLLSLLGPPEPPPAAI